jgi:hypothetical protein
MVIFAQLVEMIVYLIRLELSKFKFLVPQAYRL